VPDRHGREARPPGRAVAGTPRGRVLLAGEILAPGLRWPEHAHRHPPRRAPLREHRHVRPRPAARGAEYVGDPQRGTIPASRLRGHRLHLPAALAASARRSPPSSASAATPNTAAAQAHASSVTTALGTNPETSRRADTSAATAPPASAPA